MENKIDLTSQINDERDGRITITIRKPLYQLIRIPESYGGRDPKDVDQPKYAIIRTIILDKSQTHILSENIQLQIPHDYHYPEDLKAARECLEKEKLYKWTMYAFPCIKEEQIVS